MFANNRIQWFHKKILEMSYPNANRLSERFAISHRQAQRDVDFLRNQLNAPIEYDASEKGFYYTKPYSLPILLTSSNDDTFVDEAGELLDKEDFSDDSSVIQMQIPYTATIELEDRLAVLELASYITGRAPHHRYSCEFKSVERFLSSLMVASAPAKIIEPAWLRERLIQLSRAILEANQSITDDEKETSGSDT